MPYGGTAYGRRVCEAARRVSVTGVTDHVYAIHRSAVAARDSDTLIVSGLTSFRLTSGLHFRPAMAIETHTLTPRRSKRYQPQVVDQAELRRSSESGISWLGEPLLTRKTKAVDVRDVESFDEDEGCETVFYNGFSKLGGTGNARSYDYLFYLGDMVLVKTHGKLPSIGVIVAMWEVRPVDDIPYEQVKVHWFLRPSELPNVRARREHEAVRL